MAETKLPPDVTVEQIMAKNPATLDRNDTLDLADDVMSVGRIRHMPVIEEGNVVGIISQRDLFRSALVKALGFGSKTQTVISRTIKVKEIMTNHVITISPDASVKEAARVMIERKIGCLPVVEDEKLVGLVTETDILRYVVEH
jgi:CBS domain-containing membrane protein